METIDLFKDLQGNPYPGRGIVLGRSECGRHAVIAYFIMGRSENSRNRVFTEKDGGIITEAFDPAKLVDPSLIIYAPVRVMAGGVTVATNGDQTDTVVEHLERGQTFEDALRTRAFEPDAPNFTPRISGMVTVQNGQASYKLSILKSCGGDPESPQRFFFDYPAPKAGEGHFIHTYVTDGNPIPSFEGEPKRVALAGDIDAFTQGLWQSLNGENKVSLFTRYVDLATGETQTRIVNKHTK
jgi:phosphoribosylglycinamide formyltransferase-1